MNLHEVRTALGHDDALGDQFSKMWRDSYSRSATDEEWEAFKDWIEQKQDNCIDRDIKITECQVKRWMEDYVRYTPKG